MLAGLLINLWPGLRTYPLKDWPPARERKSGLEVAFDRVAAHGAAIEAEVVLTRSEAKWVGDRLKALTQAVGDDAEYAKAQLADFQSRLAELQAVALRRKDDEAFLMILLSLD